MMTDTERSRLLALRLKSKRGGGLDEEGMRFCQAMLKKDPDGYREVGDEVNRTVTDEMRLR